MGSPCEQVLGEWQSLYDEFLSAERAAEKVQQTLAQDPKWPITPTEPSMTDLAMPDGKQHLNDMTTSRPWTPLPGELFEAVAEDCWTEDAVAVEEELLRRLKAQSPNIKPHYRQPMGHVQSQLPRPANNVPARSMSPTPTRPQGAINFSTPQHPQFYPSAAQLDSRSQSRLRSTMPGSNPAADNSQRNIPTRASMPAAFAQPASQESILGVTSSPALPRTSQTGGHTRQHRNSVTNSTAQGAEADPVSPERPTYPHINQQPALHMSANSVESPQPSHTTHVAYPHPTSALRQSLRLRYSIGRTSIPSPIRSTPRDNSPGRGSYAALHHKRQNSPPRPYPPAPRDELFEALHRGVSPNRLRLLIKAIGSVAYERALRMSREARTSSASSFHDSGPSPTDPRKERQQALSGGAASGQKSWRVLTSQQQQQQLRRTLEQSSYSATTNQQGRLQRDLGVPGPATQPFLSSDQWPHRWSEDDQVPLRGQPEVVETGRAARKSPAGLRALRSSAPSASAAPAPQLLGREAYSVGGRPGVSPLASREKRRAERTAGPSGKRSPRGTAAASPVSISATAGVDIGEGLAELRRGGSGGMERTQSTGARCPSVQVLHASASTRLSPGLFISPQAYREYAARDQQQGCGGAIEEDPGLGARDDDRLGNCNMHRVQRRLTENMDAAGRRSLVLPPPPVTVLFRDISDDGSRAPPYDLDPNALRASRASRRHTETPPSPSAPPAIRHPSPSAPGAPDAAGRHDGSSSSPSGHSGDTVRKGIPREIDPPKFELLEDTDTEFECYEQLSGSRGNVGSALAPSAAAQMEWHANPAYGLSVASSSGGGGGGSAAVRATWPVTPGRGEPTSEPSLASMLPGVQVAGAVAPAAAAPSTGNSAAAVEMSSLSGSLRRSVESRAGAYAWPGDATKPDHSLALLQRIDAHDHRPSAVPQPPSVASFTDLQLLMPTQPVGAAEARGGEIVRNAKDLGMGGSAAGQALTAAAAAVVATVINNASERVALTTSTDPCSQQSSTRAVALSLDVASITEQLSHLDLASLELIRGYASGYIDGRVQALPHHGQIRSQVVKSAVLRLVDDVLQAKKDAAQLQAPPPSADSAVVVLDRPSLETTAVVAAAAMATATAPPPAAPAIFHLTTAPSAAMAPAAPVVNLTDAVDEEGAEEAASAAPASATRIRLGQKSSMALFHEELVARIQQVADGEEGQLGLVEPPGEKRTQPAQAVVIGVPLSSASGGRAHRQTTEAPQVVGQPSNSGDGAGTTAVGFATIGGNIQSPGGLSAGRKRDSWESDMGSWGGEDHGLAEEDGGGGIPRPRAPTPQRMRLPSKSPVVTPSAVGLLVNVEEGAACHGGPPGAAKAAHIDGGGVMVAPIKAEVCSGLLLDSHTEDGALGTGLLGSPGAVPPPQPPPSHRGPSAPGPLSALLSELSNGGTGEGGTVFPVPQQVQQRTPPLHTLPDEGRQAQATSPGGSARGNSLSQSSRDAKLGGGGRGFEIHGDGSSSSRSISSDGYRQGQRSSSLAQLIAAHLADELAEDSNIGVGSDQAGIDPVLLHAQPEQLQAQQQTNQPPSTRTPQPSQPQQQPQHPAKVPAQPIDHHNQLTPEQIQIQQLRHEIEELKRQAFWAQRQQEQLLQMQQRALASQAVAGEPPNPAICGGSNGDSAASYVTRGFSIPASSNGGATGTGAAVSTTFSAVSGARSVDAARSETRGTHRVKDRVEGDLRDECTMEAGISEAVRTMATVVGEASRQEQAIPAHGSPRSGGAAVSGCSSSSPRGPGSAGRVASAARAWPYVSGTYPGSSGHPVSISNVSIASLTSPPRARGAMGIVLSKPAYAGVLSSPPLSPASSRPAKLQAMSTSPTVNAKAGDGHGRVVKDRSPSSSGRSGSPGRKGAVSPRPRPRPILDLDQALRTESMWFVQQLEAAMSKTGAGAKASDSEAELSGAGAHIVAGAAGDGDASVSDGRVSVGVGGSPRGDQLLRELVARGLPRAGKLLQELREASLDELAAAVVGLLSSGGGMEDSNTAPLDFSAKEVSEFAPVFQESRHQLDCEATGRRLGAEVPHNGGDANANGDDSVRVADKRSDATLPTSLRQKGQAFVHADESADLGTPVSSAMASLRAPPPSAEAEGLAAETAIRHSRTSVFATDAAAVAAAVATVAAVEAEALPSQQHSDTTATISQDMSSHGSSGLVIGSGPRTSTSSSASPTVAVAVAAASTDASEDTGVDGVPSVGHGEVALDEQSWLGSPDQSLRPSTFAEADVGGAYRLAATRPQNPRFEVISASDLNDATHSSVLALSSQPVSSRRSSNSEYSGNSGNHTNGGPNGNSSMGGASHRRLLDPQGVTAAPPRGVAMAYMRRQPSSGQAAPPPSPPSISALGIGPNGPINNDPEVCLQDSNSAAGSGPGSASRSPPLKTAGGVPALISASAPEQQCTHAFPMSPRTIAMAAVRDGLLEAATVGPADVAKSVFHVRNLGSAPTSHLNGPDGSAAAVVIGSAAADHSDSAAEAAAAVSTSEANFVASSLTALTPEFEKSTAAAPSLETRDCNKLPGSETKMDSEVPATVATPSDTPADSGANTPTRSKPRDGKSIEPVLTELRAVRARIAAEGDPDGSCAICMAELLERLDNYRRGVERRHGSSHTIVTQLRILHGDMSKWLRTITSAGGSAPSKQTRMASPSLLTHGIPLAERGASDAVIQFQPLQQQQQEKLSSPIARESLSSVNTDATFDLVGASVGVTPRDSGAAPSTEAFAFPPQRQLTSQHRTQYENPPMVLDDAHGSVLPSASSSNPAPSVPMQACEPVAGGGGIPGMRFSPRAAPGVVNSNLNAAGLASGTSDARNPGGAASLPGAAAMGGADPTGHLCSPAPSAEHPPSSSTPGQPPAAASIGGGAGPGSISLMDFANQLNNMTLQQQKGMAAGMAGGGNGGAAAFLPGARNSKGAQAAVAEATPSWRPVGMAPAGAEPLLTPSTQQPQAHSQQRLTEPSAPPSVSELERRATDGGQSITKKESLKRKFKSKWSLGVLLGGKK